MCNYYMLHNEYQKNYILKLESRKSLDIKKKKMFGIQQLTDQHQTY